MPLRCPRRALARMQYTNVAWQPHAHSSLPCSDLDKYHDARPARSRFAPHRPPLPMTYTQRTLLLLLSFSSLVAAVNFTQCLQDLKNDPNATGGVDSHGHPTSPAQAVGFTYRTCTARCGSGPGSFDLKFFTQSFSSWLLPWLALISELPFGSGNYADDFVSGQPPSSIVASSIAYPNTFPHSLSRHERWVPRPCRILPHAHLPKCSISLS